MKNKIFYYLLFIILALGNTSAICSIKETNKPTSSKEFIYSDIKISNCTHKKLNDQIIVITSKYCPHCKELLNILKPLVTKNNLENKFKTLDVINSKNLKELNDLNIEIYGVPVLIINCHAYVGLKQKNLYAQLVTKFKKELQLNNK